MVSMIQFFQSTSLPLPRAALVHAVQGLHGPGHSRSTAFTVEGFHCQELPRPGPRLPRAPMIQTVQGLHGPELPWSKAFTIHDFHGGRFPRPKASTVQTFNGTELSQSTAWTASIALSFHGFHCSELPRSRRSRASTIQTFHGPELSQSTASTV